jgi:transcription factor C subunit 3
MNRPSSDQSISQHRKVLNISSLPQEQTTLMRVDIGQFIQILDLKSRKYDANQLENLSAALTWSNPPQLGLNAGFVPSVSESDLQHKSGEHSKAAYKAADLLHPTEKTEVGLATNTINREPAPVNLERSAPKRTISRNEITDHISTLLMEMLIERGGVLPGGHSLWRALATVWNTRYPEKSIPKTKDYQWALSRMLKNKAVLEHWHGFQDHSGLFSKCQILTLPHLDAFSPETLAVVESIKLRHPQPFVPAQSQPLSSDTGPGEKKENRRGRRVLAGEVAQLDAPVYAAQASAKKRHGIMSDTNSPSKRRKGVQTSIKSQAFTSTPTPADEKYRVRWASNNLLSNRMDIPKLDTTHSNYGVKVQFLAPNRFLEDDWCVNGYGVPQRITQPFPIIDMEATQQQPTSTAKSIIAERVQCIAGKDGTWPYRDLQFFEEKAINSNFTVFGWMPDIEWFQWADWAQSLEKRISGNDTGRQCDTGTAHDELMTSLLDCLSVELAQTEQFAKTLPLAAGPHNIFINLSAGLEHGIPLMDLRWQSHEHLTPQSIGKFLYGLRSLSSSDDSDSDLDLDAVDLNHPKHLLGATDANQSKIKRVSLITRPLTSIFQRETYASDELRGIGAVDNPLTNQEDLLTAFIVVRVLLGGADKAIDWGILLHIFPNTRLASLRKFWATACKEQRPHIKKLTRDVQERLIEGFESQELPMIDFEDPIHYDWRTLTKWAIRISRQKNYHIPHTRELLSNRFSLITTTSAEEDWGERFFHAQSSIFSRFEAVTSEPGALRVDGIFDQGDDGSKVQDLDIARSWIKSLCCTSEAKYSVRKIKDKFLTLSGDSAERSSLLLKEAIVQLTIQRVICRSKKTPLGGRPYRLSEWYLSTLNRVAQRSKYQDAAAFKTQMDGIFRTGGIFEIPYTLNDGSMMALTNLNAAGRIKLVPLDIPNIPFGFEPGNYESRKYPKSYYHFRLRAKPTNLYQYNEDITVLQAVAREGLPSTTMKGEIPQWVDFFGRYDTRRWCDILGAFCFTYATKGPMAAKDVCNSLSPILDEFEARLIIEWGIKTNVLEEVMDGSSVTVGEWWWLAVPWQYDP